MYSTSSKIRIPSKTTLAGIYSKKNVFTDLEGELEIHSIGLEGVGGWNIFSIDALYGGQFSLEMEEMNPYNIVLATHTHYAPMIDKQKKDLGDYSEFYFNELLLAARKPAINAIDVNRCELYIGSTNIPVYRRFDYPNSFYRKVLSRLIGRFPNRNFPVDKRLFIFLFYDQAKPEFAIVYHACHPISRNSNSLQASADYISAIRKAIFDRFSTKCCIFMQGCAGDIRPNITEKRIGFLPFGSMNNSFCREISEESQDFVDKSYYNSVFGSNLLFNFCLDGEKSFKVIISKFNVNGLGDINVKILILNENFKFIFLPFEVSHHYHLKQLKNSFLPKNFIVSCANNTIGYLPHYSQLPFGGYEVDLSRSIFGIKNRIFLGGDFL